MLRSWRDVRERSAGPPRVSPLHAALRDVREPERNLLRRHHVRPRARVRHAARAGDVRYVRRKRKPLLQRLRLRVRVRVQWSAALRAVWGERGALLRRDLRPGFRVQRGKHLRGVRAAGPALLRLGLHVGEGVKLEAVIEAQRERSKTLKEMAAASRFFFEAPAIYDDKSARKHLTAEAAPVLEESLSRLSALANWQTPDIHQVIQAQAEASKLGLGKVAQPLRVAVSGGSVSPPIDQTLAILGREETIRRLSKAISFAAR